MLKVDVIKLKTVDRWAWRPAAAIGELGALGANILGSRPATHTLILRPGGMGDLILLTLAIEEMGLDPRSFDWLIEKRSELWAKRLGLRYLAYDRDPLRTHFTIAGAYARVINTEQRFGLSQATALLARRRGGQVSCFSTNLASARADLRVEYDPFEAHESVEFSRLIAAALTEKLPRVQPLSTRPLRSRRQGAEEGRWVAVGGLQSVTRALSVEHWARITRAWAQGEPVRVVAGPTDEEFARALIQVLPKELRSDARSSPVLIGHDFDEVCQNIARASEILTIDGGLLHVASYYGVPTTVIFTSSREKKWAPLASGSRTLMTSGLSCQPCALFAQVPPCPNRYACREVEFPRDLRPA
jgi:hypothetical protein